MQHGGARHRTTGENHPVWDAMGSCCNWRLLRSTLQPSRSGERCSMAATALRTWRQPAYLHCSGGHSWYRVTTWLYRVVRCMVDDRLQPFCASCWSAGMSCRCRRPAHFVREVPSCRLVNYRTENSTFALLCELCPCQHRRHAGNARRSAGRSATAGLVLDRHGEPDAAGRPGEAWLGGDGVVYGV